MNFGSLTLHYHNQSGKWKNSHTFILPYFHTCFPLTLSYFHTFTLAPFHTFTLAFIWFQCANVSQPRTNLQPFKIFCGFMLELSLFFSNFRELMWSILW